MKKIIITLIVTPVIICMILISCNQPANNTSSSTNDATASIQKERVYKPANIQEQEIHSRGIEAAVWGMSAVNTRLMLDEMTRKTNGKENEILYWSMPADSENQTLTPPDVEKLIK